MPLASMRSRIICTLLWPLLLPWPAAEKLVGGVGDKAEQHLKQVLQSRSEPWSAK
jgi:hypothetical protein